MRQTLTIQRALIFWAAELLWSMSCTMLCIASDSSLCFSAFGMPSLGAMSPTTCCQWVFYDCTPKNTMVTYLELQPDRAPRPSSHIYQVELNAEEIRGSKRCDGNREWSSSSFRSQTIMDHCTDLDISSFGSSESIASMAMRYMWSDILKSPVISNDWATT